MVEPRPEQSSSFRAAQPPPRPRRRGGVVGPIILIFIGGVLLLENTGYLPPNFWMNLWHLWPLVLVLVGVELLLAGRVPWPVLAGVAAVILIIGAVVTRPSAPLAQPAAAEGSSTTRTALNAASRATVTIRFGAGQLNVNSLDSSDTALASMTYQGPRELAPVPRYTTQDGVGQLEYQSHGPPPGFPFPGGGSAPGAAQMDVSLTPNVPITSLALETGAASATLDLSALQVENFDLSLGATTAWVSFPENGRTTAHISGGASTITLAIPEGVAAQIQHHGGLSTLNINQARFPAVDDSTFRSPDYDSNPKKLDVSLDTGVSTISTN